MGFLAKDEDSGAGRIDERICSRDQSICRFMRTPYDEALLRSAKTGGPSAGAARPWILAATILGSSMAFIDGTVVNVVLPTLQTTFHASVVDVQWVVESYGIFLSALILAGGALGDSLGRRRIFLIGVGYLRRHLSLALSAPVFRNSSPRVLCKELARPRLFLAVSQSSVPGLTKSRAAKPSARGPGFQPLPPLSVPSLAGR
jgi:hypothetical protein